MTQYLFVTGKLAEEALRKTLEKTSLEYEVAVLPISAAALMDTAFIAKHLGASAKKCNCIMIPGMCSADTAALSDKLSVNCMRGPNNLKDIPSFLGRPCTRDGYGLYRTKIFAEIVDAYRLSLPEILARARYFHQSGADIIDLGCPVEGNFSGIEDVIRALKAEGFLVSVDSLNADHIIRAHSAGIDYVLSLNSGNIELARRLNCTAVIIPDPDDQGLESLERNISRLEAWKIPFIIDPVLNPIGFGFMRSLQNYITMRGKYPAVEMLMGAGNITELTDADSTGISALLAGIAAELQIDYVLTTEVVSWARGAVREMDLARRLMHYAGENKVLPKHVDDGLITIKDPPFDTLDEEELRRIQTQVRDRNLRIFTGREFIYVFNNSIFIKGKNIDDIFGQLEFKDPSYAFYIGKELQKAATALRLGKEYIQDEDLRWGYLGKS